MEDADRRIAALETELAALKAGTAAAPEPESSRREMFKKLGLAGAGVVVGGVLAQASPAAATDGGGIVIGDEAQTAQSPTALVASSFTGGQVLLVDDSSGFTAGGSDNPGALAGWSGSRTGIYGYTATGAFGVAAVGASTNSTGLKAFGHRANAELTPSGAPAPQRAVAHNLGELVEDDTGDLWLCVVAGNPGTWRKLGGPATSGQLHLLTAPVRVYDSRPGNPPVAIGPKTPIAPGQERTLDATVNSSGVPTSALGILANLTVVNTEGSGYLAVFKNGITWPGTSNLNWFADSQIVANSATTAVANSGLFQVRGGGVGGTDFLVDVVGYFA